MLLGQVTLCYSFPAVPRINVHQYDIHLKRIPVLFSVHAAFKPWKFPFSKQVTYYTPGSYALIFRGCGCEHNFLHSIDANLTQLKSVLAEIVHRNGTLNCIRNYYLYSSWQPHYIDKHSKESSQKFSRTFLCFLFDFRCAFYPTSYCCVLVLCCTFRFVLHPLDVTVQWWEICFVFCYTRGFHGIIGVPSQIQTDILNWATAFTCSLLTVFNWTLKQLQFGQRC